MNTPPEHPFLNGQQPASDEQVLGQPQRARQSVTIPRELFDRVCLALDDHLSADDPLLSELLLLLLEPPSEPS
ncbi:hypothetical protein [Pseudomonas sp. NW5]|uniref:hypothetical protein n=1 Tax=Pseudomonas sp. NW5 TaxID=2934934 RepID=UPI0020212310|nr:hypothetical protein [Pseudomonas sp. NW5]MCL7463016.1 hypothetical protein [Pseudomonas sp. NW5]